LFEYSAVVIDNDSDGPARQTVVRLEAETGVNMTYAIERERTIPAARNLAVQLARGNYIGIIDDDEFPPPNWLLNMYEAIQTFGVDGALGPVYPFFTSVPPAWLLKSGFCDSRVYQRTGTTLTWTQTRTGNVLLKRSVFTNHGLSFDRSFRTGGSDQAFFRQAMAHGCRFVAVDEAPVYETVPPTRWTRKYWLKRALVNGFNSARYAKAERSLLRRCWLTLSAVGRAIAYASALPLFALMGHHRAMFAAEKGCYHFSRACAGIGIEVWKVRDF